MVAERGARNAPLQRCCLCFYEIVQVTVLVRVSNGLLGPSSAKYSFPQVRFFGSGWLARKEPLQPQLGFFLFLLKLIVMFQSERYRSSPRIFVNYPE